ncbi:MAG: c-type cytochrome, partial [Flavobacteriales bacterium]
MNITISMQKLKFRNLQSRLSLFLLTFLFTFSINLFAQEGDAAQGEKLFKANCAACHKLDKKAVG